jgi:hypothetical protein
MTKLWYYASNGNSIGPFPEDELRGLVKDGVLMPDTLVWSADSNYAAGGWIRAGDTELASLFAAKKETQSVHQDNSSVFTATSYTPNCRQINKIGLLAKNFFDKFHGNNGESDPYYDREVEATPRLFNLSFPVAVALIILSVLVYVLLKYYVHSLGNGSILTRAKGALLNNLILKPYTLLFVTSLLHALRSSVVPVILYIIVLRLSGGAYNWLIAKKVISIIAIIGLGLILYFSFKPKSIIDVGALINWFWRFVDTCLMAVAFGFLFNSKKFGVAIAVGAMFILNTSVKLALAGISGVASWFPVVSGIVYNAEKLGYLILNCVEISQVLMLAAVSIIFKSIIDYKLG